MLTAQAPTDRSLAVDTHRYLLHSYHYFHEYCLFFTFVNNLKHYTNYIISLTASYTYFFNFFCYFCDKTLVKIQLSVRFSVKHFLTPKFSFTLDILCATTSFVIFPPLHPFGWYRFIMVRKCRVEEFTTVKYLPHLVCSIRTHTLEPHTAFIIPNVFLK